MCVGGCVCAGVCKSVCVYLCVCVVPKQIVNQSNPIWLIPGQLLR